MRQGQHKNRSRGRNQRRSGNPANRVYESNGPDVKVRGTAQTVADKYLQLARDAVSSGDIVMSESYYQHAEHYMRIIAANQSQQQQQQQQREQERQANAEANGAAANEAPGTGPQPGETPAGTGEQPGVEEARSNGNGQNADDGASFDGDLPQFLKAPADEDAPAEKPKRARRPRKKDVAEAADDADSSGASEPSEPASDAEAVAS